MEFLSSPELHHSKNLNANQELQAQHIQQQLYIERQIAREQHREQYMIEQLLTSETPETTISIDLLRKPHRRKHKKS